MSNIKQLSQHLKVLEFLGLQHFPLSKLNLNSRNLKNIPKKFKIYFIFQLFVVILICGMEYWHFRGMKEAYGTENHIGYAFRFTAATAASVRTFFELLESFSKAKNNQKFFIKLQNLKNSLRIKQ